MGCNCGSRRTSNVIGYKVFNAAGQEVLATTDPVAARSRKDQEGPGARVTPVVKRDQRVG